MSSLTGLINRVVGTSPGWEASSVLPIQRRATPAAPVMGTDESGKMQPFTQPGMALGVPGMISSPVKSLATSADKLEQGQVPNTEDVMPFLLATASPSLGSEGDAALSAGSRFKVIEGGKTIPVVKGAAPAEAPTSLGFFLAHKVKGREQYDYNVIGKKEPPMEGSFGMQVTAPFKSQAEAMAELKRMKASGEASDIMVLPAEKMRDYLNDHNTRPKRLDRFLAAEKEAGLINRPNITPGSIAGEHAGDVARLEREAMDKLKYDTIDKRSGVINQPREFLPEEKDLLQKYVDDSDYFLKPDEKQKLLNIFDQHAAPSPKDTTLFRGFEVPSNSNVSVGQVFGSNDGILTSTSTRQDVARSFAERAVHFAEDPGATALLLTVPVKKGSRMLDLSSHKWHNESSESEVALPPGVTFKITKVTKSEPQIDYYGKQFATVVHAEAEPIFPQAEPHK